MRFTWDPAKNERNLQERGLDFARAAPMWDAPMLVWIDHVHIFSFRKANARETKRYKEGVPTKDDPSEGE